MKSVIFHSFEDTRENGYDKNSRASGERPLIVNCAGRIHITSPFTTASTNGREDFYLMYINDGQLRTELDGKEIRVGATDVLLFPPKYKYRYTLAPGGSVSYYFAHFTGSHAATLLKQLDFTRLPAVYHAGCSAEAMDGFRDMFESYTRDDCFRDHSTAAALERILIELGRACKSREKPQPLAHSLAYVKAFFSEDISIPDLATMEGLSVSRYNALFKETTGTTPVRYITDLRMKQAAALLKGTDLHVREIGASVGYQDNHFFSKLFKEKMGVSPQKYRESN